METVPTLLLDIDGTLVDSNDAHAASWVDTLADFGFAVPFTRVRSLIGKGSDKLLPELTDIESDSLLGRAITHARAARFAQHYLPKIEPFPKAKELISRVHGDGYRIVIATSAAEDEMAGLLHVAEVEPWLYERTSSQDAAQSKPDPDIIEAALARADVPAAAAIMLGDTPYDVSAATHAGVRTVALRCGGWREEALRGAIAVYDDPADLLAQYKDSPLAR